MQNAEKTSGEEIEARTMFQYYFPFSFCFMVLCSFQSHLGLGVKIHYDVDTEDV